MTYALFSAGSEDCLPAWVPAEVSVYLEHTEAGRPLRALARAAGVHASTVLRQVRAMEARREDMLVDGALTRLGRCLMPADAVPGTDDMPLSSDALAQEARRVLRRMCEPGAVLAVAADMDKAVVVREAEDTDPTRRAVVDRAPAEALALCGWIACDRPGRVSRYLITAAGRAALNRLLAEAENRAQGFGGAPPETPAGTPRPRAFAPPKRRWRCWRGGATGTGAPFCLPNWPGPVNGCARISRWRVSVRAAPPPGTGS